MAIRPANQGINISLRQQVEAEKENLPSTIENIAQKALLQVDGVITRSLAPSGKRSTNESDIEHIRSKCQEIVKGVIDQLDPKHSTSAQLFEFLANVLLQAPEPNEKERVEVEVNQQWVDRIPVLFQEGLGRYLTDGQQTQVLRIIDQLKTNREFVAVLTRPRCRSQFKNLIIRDLRLEKGHKIEAVDISRAVLLALLSRAHQYQDGNCYVVAPFIYAQAEDSIALLKFFWRVLGSHHISIGDVKVSLDSLFKGFIKPREDKNTRLQFAILKTLDVIIQNSNNDLKFLYDYFQRTLIHPLLIFPDVKNEGHRLGGVDLKGRVHLLKSKEAFFNWVAPGHEQDVEWVKHIFAILHHNLDPYNESIESLLFKARGMSGKRCLKFMELFLGPCHQTPLPARHPEELVELLRQKGLPRRASWVLPEHLALFDRALLLEREPPEERRKRIDANVRGNYNIAYRDFAKAYKVPHKLSSEELGNPLSLAIELQQHRIASGRKRQSLPELTNLICDRFGLPRMEFLGTANWSQSDCEFFILALHSFETNQLEIVYTNGYDLIDGVFDATFTSQLLHPKSTVLT